MAGAPDTLPAGTQMQGVTAPDTLPANFAVQNVQAPLGTQIANANGMPGGPPPPDPFGVFKNIGQGIKNVGQSLGQLPGKLKTDIGQAGTEFNTANEQGNIPGEVGALGKGLFRAAGDTAIAATSPISEGIGAALNTAGNVPVLGTGIKGALTGGVKGVSDFISNSPIVQKFAMDHPQAEDDFNRALTLILLSAGGPKAAEAAEAAPEAATVKGVAQDVGARAKAVGSDLVKSPMQLAKNTGQVIAHPIETAKGVGKAGITKGQNLLMPEIPENVRNAAAKMSTDQIQSLVQAQKENRANAGSYSAMEKVGNTALRDLKTINSKLSNVGSDKSAIMDSAAGRSKVGPIVTKFLQEFNLAVRDKAQLRGDESLVRDIQNQAKLIGNNPSAQAVDRFVDYVQERVYSGSRDLTIPQSEPVEQVARQAVGKLNEALKEKMPEAYRTLNKKYSDMVKVRDEFNNAMGKGGDRSANFLKTIFSPFSARVKKVLPQVQALTGNDLISQAQVAKHIMDVMGATAQKSLLENQTGLSSPPSTLGKAAFDFGLHKIQQGLGGEDVQIQRLMQHANDAHLQSQTTSATAPRASANLNTIPRMTEKTGNTNMSTEIQKTTPTSQNISAKKPSAGAMGNKVAQPVKDVKFDVGVTSFRGTPVKTVDEVKPYFDTPRAKGFESSLNNPPEGVKVNDVTRVAGSWEGSIEPSFAVKGSGKEADALSYAVAHAKKANQDAVIFFKKNKEGGGTKDTFRVGKPDAALKQLKKNGIPGATVDGNYISIYDADGSLRDKVSKLMDTKGFEHIDTVLGDVKLIFKDDYKKYER